MFFNKISEKKYHIILIMILCIMLGIIYSMVFVPQTHIASCTVVLLKIKDSDNSENLKLTSNLISTYKEIITSDTNINKIKEELYIDEKIDIDIYKVTSADAIKIEIKNTNSDIALSITNKLLNNFSKEIENMYGNQKVYSIDKPHIESISYANKILIILFFTACGILISIVYLIILVKIENENKRSLIFQKEETLKILAQIPLNSNKNANLYINNNEVRISKYFDDLKINIQFLNVNNKGKNTILITSPYKNDGKSYIAANIAVNFAKSGKKVILIDANMLNGKQSKIFNIPNNLGFSNYLSNLDTNGMEINDLISKFITETTVKNLNIITSGTIPPNPDELLNLPKLKQLIKDLSVFYDVVLIDGNSILDSENSLILTKLVNSSLLVVDRRIRKEETIKANKKIKAVGGKVIGIVINRVRLKKQIRIDKKTLKSNVLKIKNKFDSIKDIIKSKSVKSEQRLLSESSKKEYSESKQQLDNKINRKINGKQNNKTAQIQKQSKQNLKGNNINYVEKQLNYDEEERNAIEEYLHQDDTVLVIIDAENTYCRVFSKICFIEKAVKNSESNNNIFKSFYLSKTVRQERKILKVKYNLTDAQMQRIDILIYMALCKYDKNIQKEKKIKSNKAQEYIICMLPEYERCSDENDKQYITRCQRKRKISLAKFKIDIEYKLDNLWNFNKMSIIDKMIMSKLAKQYEIENEFKNEFEVQKSKENQVFYDDVVKAREQIANAEYIVNEVAKEDAIKADKENKENIKKEKAIDKEKNAKEKRIENEKKKLQKQKIKIERKEIRDQKKKEILENLAEKRNARLEKYRNSKKIKEAEKEKQKEEARIEEELLIDNLYPKTKHNKNL